MRQVTRFAATLICGMIIGAFGYYLIDTEYNVGKVIMHFPSGNPHDLSIRQPAAEGKAVFFKVVRCADPDNEDYKALNADERKLYWTIQLYGSGRPVVLICEEVKRPHSAIED